MTPAAFEKACLALPAATKSVQWGKDHVFKVGGRMFAVIKLEVPPVRFSFKASDMAFQLLTESGVAVPAPYLARAKWVQLVKRDALPAGELKAYLAEAHRLVAAGLTKKLRAELGLG